MKKSAKRISLIPYILDDAVLVRVKIDNLKEFSKSKKSTSKILLKIKRPRKKKNKN